MRRKADDAADFPQSAATTHTPFFLRISPYGGFFVSSTQFFVLDADCQKSEDAFGVETFPQSLIAERFMQKFKKI